MARLADPFMTQGVACSPSCGSEKVAEDYNLMEPLKAALACSVRCMAAELGSRRICMHARSTGPLKTRAASSIEHFDELLKRARVRTPD